MDNRRIERSFLDRPESRGSEGITGLAKGRQVDSPEFARQIAAARHERKGTIAEAILHDLVTEFVKPVIADPQILSSERSIAILEQLLTAVLPQLKETEEFNRLASTVLGEELEQRRNLRARRLEDTADTAT
jgi:hypothetical protein